MFLINQVRALPEFLAMANGVALDLHCREGI